ncbi:hypothetical protein [Nocardiopsis rhodophaea]|uniref:hypothetical protein n=1 Tax=Nocardiopsis rhodophaea TaxID=280238 RepID=UPI0031D85094
MAHKASAFDHVAGYMCEGGRIFGSTVLALGTEYRRLAHKALVPLDDDRTMSDAEDSLEQLHVELARRFTDYRVTVQGSVALSEATVGSY